MKEIRINAFTLAEILITLAIIGIVAALTISNIVLKYQELQTVSAVKKFYSEISGAYNRAISQHGSPDSWGWTNTGQGSEHIMDILAPYLRISKRCGAGGAKGQCFGDNQTYKTLNLSVDWFVVPSTYPKYSTARLGNGFLIWILASNSCNNVNGTSKALQKRCGFLGVDVNGYKEPNALGRDTFYFYITSYGIVPIGTKEETTYPMRKQCRYRSTDTRNGYSCAAWIIAKGNMDYLKKNVSW